LNYASNIRWLYAFSFLKMTLFPMAIITLYWKDHIGLSLAEILLLQGIFSLATLAMEYPSGYLSDRLGYRFSLNLASVLGLLGWGWYTVADSFGEVLLAEILLGISFAFVSGSDSALLYETLHQQGREESYARYDGRMVGWAQTGEAIGALFAGLFYAWYPLLPFLLQIGVWALALFVSRSLKEVPRVSHIQATSHLFEAWGTIRYVFIENRRLCLVIFLATVLGLSSFYPVWLIQPYMQQNNVPLTWFGPIWAGANAAVALFSMLSHRVHFVFGDRGMVILFLVLVLAGYLGLGLAGGLWSFLFYYLLTAMRGLQGPLLKSHIQKHSRSGNRASILSLKSFVFRLVFVCTGPLIGALADNAGLFATFQILGATLVLVLAPLVFIFWRLEKSFPAT